MSAKLANVGPPDRVEISRDGQVTSFELYDANGFCCGGAEFHASGKVVWTLHVDGEVKCGSDLPEGED